MLEALSLLWLQVFALLLGAAVLGVAVGLLFGQIRVNRARRAHETSMSAEQTRYDADLRQRESEMTRLAAESHDARAENARARQVNADAAAQLKAAELRAAELAQSVQQIDETAKSLSSKLDAAETALLQRAAEVEARDAEIATREAQLSSQETNTQETISVLQSLVAQRDAEVHRLKATLSKRDSEQPPVEKLAQSTARIATLQTLVTERDTEIERLGSELNRQRTSGTDKIAELERLVASRELDISRLETGAVTAWDTTVPHLEHRITELGDENATLRREMRSLTDKLDGQFGEAEGLRRALQERDRRLADDRGSAL